MERYINEIEAIERDTDVELDRECIGLYNVRVVFLDTGEEFRLIDDYFEKKKSSNLTELPLYNILFV